MIFLSRHNTQAYFRSTGISARFSTISKNILRSYFWTPVFFRKYTLRVTFVAFLYWYSMFLYYSLNRFSILVVFLECPTSLKLVLPPGAENLPIQFVWKKKYIYKWKINDNIFPNIYLEVTFKPIWLFILLYPKNILYF